jgi:hypothetical protein
MLNNRYRITLGGKSYSPEFQTDPQYAASWNAPTAGSTVCADALGAASES